MIQAAGGGNDHGQWWQNVGLGIVSILGAIGAYFKGKQSWLSGQRGGRQISIEETLKASPFLQDLNARVLKLHYENRRIAEDVSDIREAIQRLEER